MQNLRKSRSIPFETPCVLKGCLGADEPWVGRQGRCKISSPALNRGSCHYDLARWRFLVRAAFLAARERAAFDGRPTGPGGTRLPSRRASESPIAIACLRLFTFPPLPPLPLFKVPRLSLRTSRSTSFEAPREYFLAITSASLGRDSVSYPSTGSRKMNGGHGTAAFDTSVHCSLGPLS